VNKHAKPPRIQTASLDFAMAASWMSALSLRVTLFLHENRAGAGDYPLPFEESIRILTTRLES
jgi:hypothetical protein